MAVHNLNSRVCLLARTRCEKPNSSAPYALDVSFRVRFGGPDRPELPEQVHFKISVWNTHESATHHLLWLTQNTDVIRTKTDGHEIANDLINRARILKQTNSGICHIASPNLICSTRRTLWPK